ncbi:MAG TPA: phosphatase PAP2 family protein [Cellvibrio sp.]
MSKPLLTLLYKATINFILKQEIEVKLLIVFSFFFLIGLLQVGQICIPSFQGGKFAFDHYTLPLLFSSLVVLCISRKNWRQVILLFLFLVISVFFHFNFKSWAPIINPKNYDPVLQYLDDTLVFPKLIRDVRFDIYNSLSFNLNFLYHNLFVLNFFIINLVMAYKGFENLRSLNLSIALVLLLGGVLYWVFPASGPFIFFNNPYFEVDLLQMTMLGSYQEIRNTGVIPDGFFVSGLAAMPSLHLAHATVFLIYSMSLNIYFKILFVLSWIVFFIDSMALGWHYFIDIPVGILLGVLVSKFSRHQLKLG